MAQIAVEEIETGNTKRSEVMNIINDILDAKDEVGNLINNVVTESEIYTALKKNRNDKNDKTNVDAQLRRLRYSGQIQQESGKYKGDHFFTRGAKEKKIK